MATLQHQHRHGMVYIEENDGDSSSSEFLAESTDHLAPSLHQPPSIQPPSIIRGRVVRGQRPSMDGSSSRCSSRGAETEDSYDDIYSSSGEDSYHSECDDIAEYWDPYCETWCGGELERVLSTQLAVGE